MTTNAQVAHLWAAHNMGTSDKSEAFSANRNLWFRDRAIYSYSTKLAEFRTSVAGERYVLRNMRYYRITTTSKHQPAIARAIDYGRLVGTVEVDGELFNKEPTAIVSALIEEANECLAKAKRARSNRECYERRAVERMNDAKWLANAHGIPFDTAEEFLAQLEREREGARAWAGFVNAINSIADIGPTLLGNALGALGDIAAGVQWLAGSRTGGPNVASILYSYSQSYHYRANRHGREYACELPILLRVNGDTVETSRGAEFPLEHGLKALPYIAILAKLASSTVSRSIEASEKLAARLGHFRVDRVDEDGTVHAGCHKVPEFAVRYAARSAGAIEALELDHVSAWVNAVILGETTLPQLCPDASL